MVGGRTHLDQTGLPHKVGVGVNDPTRVHVHSEETTFTIGQRVLLAQLVENIGGIKASIVGELARDHLESLGKGINKELGFACNGTGVVPQVP
eukprot:1761005-Pyramimonas_sp.AAC.1